MNYSVALIQLPLVREHSKERILSAADVWRVCSDIGRLAQESFHVLSLNTKNRLVNRHMVSLGICNSVTVHPREVFRAALADGAAAVVVAHNHPSGDPAPSKEDLEVTERLILAGRLLGVTVIDHVIIVREAPSAGDRTDSKPFLSVRENGLCKFD